MRCPLLVVVCDQDQSALAGPAAARRDERPGRSWFAWPGGHYAPFLDGHEQAVEAELSFLRRHLLDHARADQATPRLPRCTGAAGHEADRAVRRDNRVLRTPAEHGPALVLLARADDGRLAVGRADR